MFAFNDSNSSQFAIATLVATVLLLIVWVIVYILRGVMYGSLVRVSLVKERVKLHGNGFQVVAENMPAAVNGNDFSYGFWIKLNDFSITNIHKVLWYRSSKVENMRGSPVCLLDRSSNKMYFILATNLTKTDLSRQDILGKAMDDVKSSESVAVVMLDYLPMNRWSHVALVVRDRYVSIFLDGEVYNSGTVDSLTGTSTNVSPVISPPSGTVYIGGEPTINGEITKMEFANYAVSVDDVKAMYLSGPTQRLVGIAGLDIPMYGLRWPVYKIGS